MPVNLKIFLPLLLSIIVLTAISQALPLDYKIKNILLTPEETITSTSAAGETPYMFDELAVFQFSTHNGSDCWGMAGSKRRPIRYHGNQQWGRIC